MERIGFPATFATLWRCPGFRCHTLSWDVGTEYRNSSSYRTYWNWPREPPPAVFLAGGAQKPKEGQRVVEEPQQMHQKTYLVVVCGDILVCSETPLQSPPGPVPKCPIGTGLTIVRAHVLWRSPDLRCGCLGGIQTSDAAAAHFPQTISGVRQEYLGGTAHLSPEYFWIDALPSRGLGYGGLPSESLRDTDGGKANPPVNRTKTENIG